MRKPPNSKSYHKSVILKLYLKLKLVRLPFSTISTNPKNCLQFNAFLFKSLLFCVGLIFTITSKLRVKYMINHKNAMKTVIHNCKFGPRP